MAIPIRKIIRFFTTDIWRLRLKDLSGPKSFAVRQVRVFQVAFRGFREDRCYIRASALTLYSLLAIVPVLALAFGIAQGFGVEHLFEKQLMINFPGQEEIILKVIQFAHTLLESTRGGMMAIIGVVFLFWIVVRVLNHIEGSFNDIWGLKSKRSLGRKISDFLAVLFVFFVLFVVSSSIMVFLSAQAALISEKSQLIRLFDPYITFVLKYLPFGIIPVLFTFLYIFMPNTRVSFRSGLFGGVVGSLMYAGIQWVYIAFQIGVVRYNVIYGSFAFLPLFMIWLQVSWLVIFFGAEVSFAHQNVDMHDFDSDYLKTNLSVKRLIALRIVQLLIKDFTEGVKPLTAVEISHQLEIPIRLVRQLLFDLVESGIIVEVYTPVNKEIAYQPALDPEKVTIHFVIDALDHRGSNAMPVAYSKEIKVLEKTLQSYSDMFQISSHNQRIKDL